MLRSCKTRIPGRHYCGCSSSPGQNVCGSSSVVVAAHDCSCSQAHEKLGRCHEEQRWGAESSAFGHFAETPCTALWRKDYRTCPLCGHLKNGMGIFQELVRRCGLRKKPNPLTRTRPTCLEGSVFKGSYVKRVASGSIRNSTPNGVERERELWLVATTLPGLHQSLPCSEPPCARGQQCHRCSPLAHVLHPVRQLNKHRPKKLACHLAV